MQVSMSTGCLHNLPPDQIAASAAEAGFKHVEVLLNPDMLADMGPMARALESFDLKAAVVHAPFTMDPLISAPGKRGEALALGKQVIDACNAVGSPILTLHPGSGPPPGFPSQKQIETAKLNLDALQTMATAQGVELIVENTSAYYMMGVKVSGLLGNDPDEMDEFIGPADAPVRRMTFDTSHASTLKKIPLDAFITRMGSRIANLHLSDAIGTTDHLSIGNGRIDFKKVFDALRAIRFDGNATLELRPKSSTPQELRRNRVLIETELRQAVTHTA